MYCENIIYCGPIVSYRSTVLKLKMKKIESCDQFGQLFKNLKRRNEHVKFCGNSLDWQECGKIFKTQQSLVGHKNAKHIEKYQRKVCQKCFESSST